MQDGKEVAPQNGVVELNKKTFAIEVSLTNLEGVFLYAAFADSIYKLGVGDAIPNFENLPFMAMAETDFNAEQELIVSDAGWAYWFYDKKLDWNRFDRNSVRKDGSTITGTKTIKQFYLIQDDAKSTEKVENVSSPLYLFFVSVEENKKGIPTKELERYKLRINWL